MGHGRQDRAWQRIAENPQHRQGDYRLERDLPDESPAKPHRANGGAECRQEVYDKQDILVRLRRRCQLRRAVFVENQALDRRVRLKDPC